MPYWDITLTKYKQGYGENDKTLMKEIKEGLGNWRDSQCSLIGKHNIVKMSILLNFVYSFPSQNHSKTFCEYWWTDSEVYTKRRETQSSQHNTEGEWKSGQTNTTRLKTHCKATVMQEKKKKKKGHSYLDAVLLRNRHIDQWKWKRTQKQAHTNIFNSSLTKERRQLCAKKMVLWKYGAGTIGSPYKKLI